MATGPMEALVMPRPSCVNRLLSGSPTILARLPRSKGPRGPAPPDPCSLRPPRPSAHCCPRRPSLSPSTPLFPAPPSLLSLVSQPVMSFPKLGLWKGLICHGLNGGPHKRQDPSLIPETHASYLILASVRKQTPAAGWTSEVWFTVPSSILGGDIYI